MHNCTYSIQAWDDSLGQWASSVEDQKSWGDGLWRSLLPTNGPALPRHCSYEASEIRPKASMKKMHDHEEFIVGNRSLSGSTTSRCCKLVLENWTSKRMWHWTAWSNWSSKTTLNSSSGSFKYNQTSVKIPSVAQCKLLRLKAVFIMQTKT